MRRGFSTHAYSSVGQCGSLLSFILVALIVVSVAYARSAESNLDQLSKRQQRAIEEARKSGVAVSVETIKVGCSQRTFVFLGETHVKGSTLSAAETKLVQTFNLRLLEGYMGSGKELRVSEKSILNLIRILYPALVTIIQGEQSTINKSIQVGFNVPPDGSVFYQGCRLGVFFNGDIYYDDRAIKKIISSMAKDHIPTFFQSLKTQLPLAAKAWKNLSEDSVSQLGCSASAGLAYFPVEEQCEPKSIDETQILNLGLETGNLSKWENDQRRPSNLLVPPGTLGVRDLRMAEAAYTYMTKLPDQKVALVITGRDHTEHLKDLLKNWPAPHCEQ